MNRRQFTKWCKDIGMQQKFGNQEVENIFYLVNQPVKNGSTVIEPNDVADKVTRATLTSPS